MSRIRGHLASFKWALNGLRILFKEEFNAKVHLCIAIAVVVLGFIFKINKYDWLSVIIAIAMVLVAEAVNTVIEQFADFVSPEKRPAIKRIKDVAAGAVLLAALAAFIIGLAVFSPYIAALL